MSSNATECIICGTNVEHNDMLSSMKNPWGSALPEPPKDTPSTDDSWLYSFKGQSYGPVSTLQLKQILALDTTPDNLLVRADSSSEWILASTLF